MSDPVLAFDEKDGMLLIAASDVIVGDEVCFLSPRLSSYVVEEVDEDALRRVRHRFGNDTATNSYEPSELLWVRTPRRRVLGHLGRHRAQLEATARTGALLMRGHSADALCEICNQRPGERTARMSGMEVWACASCAGE